MKLWLVSALLINLAARIRAYNILILAPLGTWSEYQLARVLADTLAEVEHKVTLVSGFKPHRYSPIKEVYVGSTSMEDQNIFEVGMIESLYWITNSQKYICNLMYTNDEVLDIWNTRNNFDAIIAFSFINDIIAPFLIDYHGSYIGLNAIGIEENQIRKQGNRLPLSVTPFTLGDFDENMNFIERTVNLVISFLMSNMYEYLMMPQIQSLLENYFPGMPYAGDLYGNYSLLLINSHFAMDGAYPLLPNQVEIGTLAARLPQPLPQELRRFVEGAEHGIIYFSLGSLAKSIDIPKPQLAMLLEAFSQLPQRVVWKFEDDVIENLPSNVIIQKWLPQQDILGHPKTLVFICHCGNFGTQEAKYHGVPVLGVPISFDQHRNAARLARKGYGLVLNWDDMTTENIIENINILIKDVSYTQRIQEVSNALQDQKESPKERAVWWIEYAIRHNDAPHLQYAGKNLKTVQFHMLDVWTLLIAMFITVMFIIYWCILILIKISLKRGHRWIQDVLYLEVLYFCSCFRDLCDI